MRLLEENIGKSLEDMGVGGSFLERIQPEQERTPGTEKCMTLRSFCTMRTIATGKKQGRDGESLYQLPVRRGISKEDT